MIWEHCQVFIFRRKVGALQSCDHPHRAQRDTGIGQRAVRHSLARRDDHDLRAGGDVLDDHPHRAPPRGAQRFVERLEVGAHEVLLDDSRLLFARAEEAGADIHLTVTENLMHMAQIWAPDWAAATESLDRAAEFAKSLTPQD